MSLKNIALKNPNSRMVQSDAAQPITRGLNSAGQQASAAKGLHNPYARENRKNLFRK